MLTGRGRLLRMPSVSTSNASGLNVAMSLVIQARKSDRASSRALCE